MVSQKERTTSQEEKMTFREIMIWLGIFIAGALVVKYSDIAANLFWEFLRGLAAVKG